MQCRTFIVRRNALKASEGAWDDEAPEGSLLDCGEEKARRLLYVNAR